MSDSLRIVQSLARTDSRRMRDYRANLDFFDGVQWAGRPRRGERRLVVNYARTLVEKAAAFTLLGLDFVVDAESKEPESDAGAKQKERALREVYEQNEMAALEFDSEVDCSVLGDGCFKVWWDVEAKRVRVAAPDVQGIYVWVFPGTVSEVWRLAQRYDVAAEDLELLVPSAAPAGDAPPTPSPATQPRASQGRPNAHKVVELWTKDVFELWVDQRLVEAKPNPYGFIPYVVYPNVRIPKQFWGVSDLKAVTESQRELNRALSQLSMILELSGNPIAVLENVTEAADIAVQPGAVWELPEKSKAYLLDLLQGGGVKLHTDYIELVYRSLHDLGESPRVSFGEADASVSGVALEIQMDPLVKKVERKRQIRAAAFRRRNEMVLRLLEQYAGSPTAPYRTRIQWGRLLPSDRTKLVADEVALVAANIHSHATAALEVGVEDPAAELQDVMREAQVLAAAAPVAAPAVPV